MPQVGSNFEYSGRNPLDARQQCESLRVLTINEKNILYPPGFKVYCLLENKEYKNVATLNEEPVWEEVITDKAWVRQAEEPKNKNLLWFKEDELEEIIDAQYTVDDLISMVKAYQSKVNVLVDIVSKLQDDIEYIKKNGIITNPDEDIDGALITDDGCYLITDDGCYLVI